MIELEPVVRSLVENQVSFVVIGGVAITVHGSAYVTRDLDFCYLRTKENLQRIVAALSPFKPHPRGFPAGLPFIWDYQTLLNGTNFTFKTQAGDVDMLGEVSGIGSYQEVEATSVIMQLFGVDVRVLSIDGLIRAKRAAGRTKDLLVLPELEALREISEQNNQ